jgi:nitrogen fixation/metabolism regulation signal transduction histidine kinase
MVKNKFRQTMYIDPVVQGQLIRRVLLHWICFVTTVLFTLILVESLTAHESNNTVEHLQSALSRHLFFFIVLATMLPLFVMDMVRISHRFSGPLLRIRQSFRTVANGGTFQPIRLREKDFLQDLTDDYNRMMEHLDAPIDFEASLLEAMQSTGEIGKKRAKPIPR